MTINAHDALSDVIALRKILFSPRLALSDELVVNRSSVISVGDSLDDMNYLDERHKRLLLFLGKLYDPVRDDAPVKQNVAKKIAGSGLRCEDLMNLHRRSGRKGLVCILMKPPLSIRSSTPRVTRTARIVSAIVKNLDKLSSNSAT